MPLRLSLALASIAIAALPVIVQSQQAQEAGELVGREAFPAPFHGVWAPTLADCGGNGLEVFQITARLFYAYESRSVLLESGGIVEDTAPDGRPAFTMTARIASSSAGEDSTGRLRLIRVGDTLYTSNPDVVGEADQYDYPNVRCPGPPPWLIPGSE